MMARCPERIAVGHGYACCHRPPRIHRQHAIRATLWATVADTTPETI